MVRLNPLPCLKPPYSFKIPEIYSMNIRFKVIANHQKHGVSYKRTQPLGCDQWSIIVIEGLTRILYDGTNEAANLVGWEEKNNPGTEAKQESLKRVNE